MSSLVRIFFQPRAVFERVRKRHIWMLPLVATLLMTTLATFLVVSLAGMELITLQHYQHDPQLAERAGNDAIDNAVDSSNSRVPKMVFLSRAGGGMLTFLLTLAGVFTGVAMVMGASPRAAYSQMLGMVSYAFFPFAVFKMLATGFLLGLTSDHSNLDLDNLTGLNIGRVFERSGASPAIYEIAMGLDLVSAAQVIFLAFGFSKTAALPFGKCLVVCGALWAMLILWKAALAAFF